MKTRTIAARCRVRRFIFQFWQQLIIHQPQIRTTEVFQPVTRSFILKPAAHLPLIDLEAEIGRCEVALVENNVRHGKIVQSVTHHGERRLRRDATNQDHARCPPCSSQASTSSNAAPPRLRSGIGVAPTKVHSACSLESWAVNSTPKS